MQELNDIEKIILGVIGKKRRSMSAKEITEELLKIGIKISRPTVAKHLKELEKKGWLGKNG